MHTFHLQCPTSNVRDCWPAAGALVREEPDEEEEDEDEEGEDEDNDNGDGYSE